MWESNGERSSPKTSPEAERRLPVSCCKLGRIYYRKTEWYKDADSAKKVDPVNWKKHVKSSPPRLPEQLAASISQIYKAYTNELTGMKWFDASPLAEVLGILRLH